MPMDRIVANVYETKNYGMFKKLLGNRDVTEKRVEKIKCSIETVGYVLSPCVINGKNEVIDGQGRIEALKRLDLPVHYVIDKTAGLEQCVSLNINGERWKTIDYVDSYIQQGNTNYLNLKELITAYPGINIGVIAYAVNRRIYQDKQKTVNNNRLNVGNAIIQGEFKCSSEQKQKAFEILEYVSRFSDIIKTVKGNSSIFMKAVIFSAFETNANKERLFKKCYECQQEILPFVSFRNALVSISKVYNKSVRKAIDFEAEYITHCNEINPGYDSRWNKEAQCAKILGVEL